MFEIEIQHRVEVKKEWIKLLETAVHTTLLQQQIDPPAALTLVLTDDAQLQQLNQQFRQQDRPTDVLSFAPGDIPGAEGYLGDILISVPFARRHAEQEGHALVEELQLLAIHGTLHLLGFDHTNESDKFEMWREQTAVLQSLNISIEIAQI